MEDVRASQHISGASPGDPRGRAAAHDAQLMRAAAASTAATMATLSLPRRNDIRLLQACLNPHSILASSFYLSHDGCIDCIILAEIHNYGTWADNGSPPTTAQPPNLGETSCRTMTWGDGLQNGVGSVTNPLPLESKATSMVTIHMGVAYQAPGDLQHQ
jgi:hypothetical protein